MLGSVFGALFLWAIFGTNWPAARAFGSNSWDPAVFTGGQVFFGEMLGTMLLMFNVLSTIDIPSEGGGPLGVYPIAMSVMVAHLFLLPIDGCSINPTRSFGPSLVASWAGIPGVFVNQQHVFWFGPMFGAAVAAIIYEYGSLKPANFEGAKDMDTALFAAGKAKGKKRQVKSRQSSLAPSTPENQQLQQLSDGGAADAYSSSSSHPLYYANTSTQNPLHSVVEVARPRSETPPPEPSSHAPAELPEDTYLSGGEGEVVEQQNEEEYSVDEHGL